MKIWKVFLSIGIIVFVLGLGVFITGLACNGWKLNTEYEMKHFVAEEQNGSLDLNISAGQINVLFYDGDTVEVFYPVSFNYGYNVSESGGTLTVAPTQSFFFLWFGWRNIPDVTVNVPRNSAPNLRLDMSAGKANVQGGEYKNVDLSLSAGTLNIVGGVNCTDFKAHLSAGNVSAEGINCPEVSFHLSAGTATAASVKCDKLDIDVSAGTVNVTVNGKESDYAVFVDKSAGSCNLSSKQGTVAGKEINVDLSAGTVNVGFSG